MTKNTISESKISLDRINRRLNSAEEKISEFGGILIDYIQSEAQKVT